jgi:hypothetical protein
VLIEPTRLYHRRLCSGAKQVYRKTRKRSYEDVDYSSIYPNSVCRLFKASTYYDDLTEEESLICEQPARFEGFVRELSSVESTRMEHTSHKDNLKSKLESISKVLIQSASHSALGYCSQQTLDSVSRNICWKVALLLRL